MSRHKFTPKLCMNRVFAINLGGRNEFVFNEEEMQAFSIWNNVGTCALISSLPKAETHSVI